MSCSNHAFHNKTQVIELLELSDKYKADQLKMTCIDHILRHYKELSSSNALLQLSKELLTEVLFHACSKFNRPDTAMNIMGM